MMGMQMMGMKHPLCLGFTLGTVSNTTGCPNTKPRGFCQTVAMRHPLCLGYTLGTVSDTTFCTKNKTLNPIKLNSRGRGACTTWWRGERSTRCV